MQINLSMENCWGIVRALVDVCSGLDDGKWLLVKDPNKPLLRLYSVPTDAFKVCEHGTLWISEFLSLSFLRLSSAVVVISTMSLMMHGHDSIAHQHATFLLSCYTGVLWLTQQS
jgi:Eukaryotic translation initiation factor 3 subunit 7 (eIF-3)